MVGSRLGLREVPAMAIDVGVPRSRRTVLAAALGGLAASAAQALGRPTAALATDGQPVVQGADNIGSASTLVRSGTTTAFQGLADATSGTAYGVRGRSNSTDGAGVVGQDVAVTGTNYGVRGIAASTGGVGVRGEAPSLGVEGISSNTADDPRSIGVLGKNASQNGAGVWGESSATNGYGVAGIGLGAGVSGTSFAEGGVGVQGSASALTGSGLGVVGYTSAPTGQGVHGEALNFEPNAVGVFGHGGGGTGVIGWVSNGGFTPVAPKTGIYGQCDVDASSHGAYGRSAAGFGVRGRTSSGYGVFAEATGTTGTALKVSGKAVFTRSGKATVPNGSSSVVVSSVTLTSSSLVIATIQGSAASGVYVRYVAPSIANSNFTIKLSKVVTADTKVGWFIVN
jgi:hypothetical protein